MPLRSVGSRTLTAPPRRPPMGPGSPSRLTWAMPSPMAPPSAPCSCRREPRPTPIRSGWQSERSRARPARRARPRLRATARRRADYRSSVETVRVQAPDRGALQVAQEARTVEIEDPDRAGGGRQPVDAGLEPDVGDRLAAARVEDAHGPGEAVGHPEPPAGDREVDRPATHLERARDRV